MTPELGYLSYLSYLSSSDTVLVENLEHTKKTALDIEEKVTESKKTSIEIDKVKKKGRHYRLKQAREFYRSSAARASVLYFILNDLNRINPMYQFSLKAFSVVFDVAIQVLISSSNMKNNLYETKVFVSKSIFLD